MAERPAGIYELGASNFFSSLTGGVTSFFCSGALGASTTVGAGFSSSLVSTLASGYG